MMIWDFKTNQELYIPPDRLKVWSGENQEWEFKNLGWPKRCTACNTRAQGYKRAKKSIQRLEELRINVQDTFEALGTGTDRWQYLKFVTLTWKNELTSESKPNMKKARKWLQKKRDKIIDALDCVAGTDVLECVTTEILPGAASLAGRTSQTMYHHHVHSHGIWIMPYHPIKYIGEIMTKYVGRDQCKAIKPLKINNEAGEYEMSPFAQARNYLMKYLTKEKGCRRGLWGFARANLTATEFYGKCSSIHQKWNQLDHEKVPLII